MRKLLKTIRLSAGVFILLSACDAQVQKNNFRTTSANSPLPQSTASQNAGEASPLPSSSGIDTNSPAPTQLPSSPNAVLSPLASNSFSPSPTSSQAPPSSSPSQTSTDTQAPVPSDDGQISVSNVSSASLNLEWSTAVDNITSSSQLQYLVYSSLSNNLQSIASTEANGTAIGFYIPDLSGKAISDLTPGTSYYFNVIVKDGAGNKAIYASAFVTTVDTTPPIPGNSGAIAESNIAATSLTVSWSLASDVISPASQLEYLLYRSNSNNISSVSDIQVNGTAIGSFTTNINTKAVTGLVSSRAYYFNVLVKDSAGNKAAYVMQQISTLDNIAPAVGNSGVITASSITPTGLSLNWTKSNDSLNAQADLQYAVYQSILNNIPSISGAETNGTLIATYTADINSKVVSGLAPNTTYYFNVIVRDLSGNKTSYAMLSVSTLPLPPTLPNRSEAYAKSSLAWTYLDSAANGSLPLVYSLSTAPSGATINSATGLISYTPSASLGDLSFAVLVTDAIGRTSTQNFTLHVKGIKTCVWTGAGDTSFTTPVNWIFCDSVAPNFGDAVVIDAAATRQPLVSSSFTVGSFGEATSGAGGTVTVAAGATLTTYDPYATFTSDVTIKGATATCTTCRLSSYHHYGYRIRNNATLRLGSGITVSLSGSYTPLDVGGVEPGHLIIDTGSSNPAEWPTFDGDIDSGTGTMSVLSVGGISAQNPSSVLIDGLNLSASVRLFKPVQFGSYVAIKKFRNINFGVNTVNAMSGYSYIIFTTCTGIIIEDKTWSGLIFPQGTRNNVSAGNLEVPLHTINAGTCNSNIGPVTISGSGRGYGSTLDDTGSFIWSNSSSSTCTWTGAIDTNWTTPGNWSNCTNGRNNYPDQLDNVVIPITANQPIVSGNMAMQGTGAGTGGGTIKVNPNSSLYINRMATDTFASSVKFAGGSAGCTTCLVQPRGDITLGDGVTLTLLPDIRFAMVSSLIVGESIGRSGRAANFQVQGGPTPANYPVIMSDPNVPTVWGGVVFDGKTATNSTASIDGLVLSTKGLILKDRFAVTKLDHLSITSQNIDVQNCSNSSVVTAWNDLTLATDPSPGYNVAISDASCSAISPITITGQGAGYGNTYSDDSNGRLNWQ